MNSPLPPKAEFDLIELEADLIRRGLTRRPTTNATPKTEFDLIELEADLIRRR